MRLFAFLSPFLLLTALAAPLSVPALAQDGPVELPVVEPNLPDEPPAARTGENDRLDELFARLRRESDAEQAKLIADRINAEWRDSGSATGNLLMQWAAEAIAGKNEGLALDFLDQVTVLWPDYVEGWNRRATLHFMMGNLSKSMADINRVLSLEPRHYGALAGMAAILERTGEEELALKAWEQILAVYPANRDAQTKVGELADQLTGRRI